MQFPSLEISRRIPRLREAARLRMVFSGTIFRKIPVIRAMYATCYGLVVLPVRRYSN